MPYNTETIQIQIQFFCLFSVSYCKYIKITKEKSRGVKKTFGGLSHVAKMDDCHGPSGEQQKKKNEENRSANETECREKRLV